MWKVGNENKVRILNQPWINDASNAYITTEVQGLDHATVAQLMNIEGDQRDNEIIEDMFNIRDQRCILNTVVGGSREEDVLYWNEDFNGEYTVKSAYEMLQRQKGLGSTADNRSLWKLVWRIKAPLKVLNMWGVNFTCVSAVSFCRSMLEETRSRAYNKVVWNQITTSINQLVYSAKQFLAEWRGAQNEVKISVDAALFADCLKFGIGLLARDAKGSVVQGWSEICHGHVRVEFAEAVIVKEALSWVKNKQWREVVIESDCLTVVQAIRSKKKALVFRREDLCKRGTILQAGAEKDYAVPAPYPKLQTIAF
ncbi:uncharacterized protein LOC141674558 [Apium graveolens]|uniref:uncharacterized protein LOC141674558 n=1 Tax=Apium graveolens TaxID=4045 RepID=UPI003D792BBD